jgi:hypothetical protein
MSNANDHSKLAVGPPPGGSVVSSRQCFRFGKWLVFSFGTFLRLRLHHLVEPTGNENSRVLLQAGIFSIAFLGIESKTYDVPICPPDRLDPRFGRGGLADLGRISQINMQHRKNVGLVALRPRIRGLAIPAGQATAARAQTNRKSRKQRRKPKTSARSAHCYPSRRRNVKDVNPSALDPTAALIGM